MTTAQTEALTLLARYANMDKASDLTFTKVGLDAATARCLAAGLTQEQMDEYVKNNMLHDN